MPEGHDPSPVAVRVANSQRPGVERDRTGPGGTETPSEPVQSPAAPMSEAGPPPEPDLALIEAERLRRKQERRIDGALAKLVELQGAAAPEEQERLAADFTVIAEAFSAGLLLSLRDNGELDMSITDTAVKEAVEEVAMTDTGFALLKALASAEDAQPIEASGNRITLVDPADDFDWLNTQAQFRGGSLSR